MNKTDYKNFTYQDLKIEKETELELKELFPDKCIGECYAIHYILSRINLCSFMYVPKKNSCSYNQYMKEYEGIKNNLTEEIIEAICKYEGVGADVINNGSKGYNLAKIFDYRSLDKEDAFFEYQETNSSVIQDMVSSLVKYQYSESLLPYICG